MFAGIALKIKAAWAVWKWLANIEKKGRARLTPAWARRDRIALENYFLTLEDGRDMGRIEKAIHSCAMGKEILTYLQVLTKSRRLAQKTDEPDVQYLTKIEVSKMYRAAAEGNATLCRELYVQITQALSTGVVPYPDYGKV
jgi:hypothetical protein